MIGTLLIGGGALLLLGYGVSIHQRRKRRRNRAKAESEGPGIVDDVANAVGGGIVHSALSGDGAAIGSVDWIDGGFDGGGGSFGGGGASGSWIEASDFVPELPEIPAIDLNLPDIDLSGIELPEIDL
jgi:hypothetical protein